MDKLTQAVDIWQPWSLPPPTPHQLKKYGIISFLFPLSSQ